MPSEPPNPKNEAGLIIRPAADLVALPNGRSLALSEIINRSLVHIRTSKSLTTIERQPGEEREFEIAAGVIMRMCWIPPGEFLMGSPKSELGHMRDETQHLVRITRGFWMGKYSVTQAQWQAVMGSNPSKFKGADLPVEGVSWDDISKLGGFLGKAKRFATTEEVFALPTEAQWEYACRAGTTTALNSGKYLTSEIETCPNLDDLAWYNANSGSATHPVGQKKGNAWGLHDMLGNVWEWCVDWYGKYPAKPLADPQGPVSGSFRVFRGGYWYGCARYCRVAHRNSSYPTYNHGPIGFRIARSSVH